MNKSSFVHIARKLRSIFLFLQFTCLNPSFSTFINGQSLEFIPGPANLDTANFAHVYFLRDKPDEFPDNWLGVVINNNHGICVKAKGNTITAVHTALTGPTTFNTKIEDAHDEVMIDLIPGNTYYIELNPIRNLDQNILGKLTLLEPSEGLNRIEQFSGHIQHRHCILPFDGDNDFLENVYSDTVHWYASGDFEYRFTPLHSWEIILRSKLKTVLAFRNTILSGTYSEVGGIRYEGLAKCKTPAEFETYVREKFIPSTLSKKKDTLLSCEINSVNPPPEIEYAMLITTENNTKSKKINNEKQLVMRSAYIVFYWKDDKGKGHTASIYDSERGLMEELHAIATLKQELLESWESFRLVKK